MSNQLNYTNSGIFEGINFDNDLLSSPSPTLKRSISKIDNDDVNQFNPDDIIQDTPPQSPTTDHFVGFTSGCGIPIQPPSNDGFKRAAKLLDADVSEDNHLTETHNSRVDALNNLSNHYNDYNDDIDHVDNSDPQHLNNPGFIGFVTAAGAPMPIPSQHAIDNAKSKYNHKPVDSNNNLQSSTPYHLENSLESDHFTPSKRSNTPLQPLQPLQLLNKHIVKNQHSTPFKPPLINSNSHLDNNVTPKSSKPRLSLGITSNKPPKRQKFVTPFKQGVIPSTKIGASTNKPFNNNQPIKHKAKNRVFNLKSSSERKSMSDYGVRPWGYTLAYLRAVNIPQIVLQMNCQSAQDFAFTSNHTSTNAFQDMKNRGCTSINLRWVKNHWKFIITKLSAIIRSCPSEMTRWSYQEVLGQLLYRYQREINLAERSAVKRIQEHDSSSSRPMILFVSQILDEKMIELSDGWYPIYTQIDSCLSRAVKRNKIKVGAKISIIGAKLNSGYEGTDVLDAVGLSNLSISGNSTSLARWDDKLGFQPPLTGFISNLSSLSPDGGIIALLDVVVTSVFPLAYMDMEHNFGDSAWNQVEENKRLQDEQNRINIDSEAESYKRNKEIEFIEDILIRLNDATTDATKDEGGADDVDVDDELDNIIAMTESKHRIQKIKSLSGSVAAKLALAARDRMTNLRKEAGNIKVEKRKIRNFRIIRVEDHNRGSKKDRISAQLHVWDAITINEEFKQGDRFKITNCNPSKVKSWPTKGENREIYISTRRNSRFYSVD
ncbi:hypothetical protein E3P89_02451 [Wallemia ichthyophaga]|nr:hypothetical protein E3P93_02409 [Wallemia ichthyophaga]TIB21803.1 hypothetical protein E3P89_02451 [Wallemia ichthyophaga]TIB23468.1 hypothetical protein E3P88_02531 [Wallemia ichthyophaga]